MTSIADTEWIDAFASSLPASYRDRHTRDVIAAHAAIAAGRGTSPANVGRFDSTRGKSVVCVVAEDRPGLLSNITAAFVVQGWDIVHAEAYTRSLCGSTEDASSEAVATGAEPSPVAPNVSSGAAPRRPTAKRSLDDSDPDDSDSDISHVDLAGVSLGAAGGPVKTEAVDLFWLRRMPRSPRAGAPSMEGREPSLNDADVGAIKESLIGLLEGRLELPECITSEEPAELHNTRVRFIEGEDGTLCTLEVETRDRSGLLLVLTRALAAQRVTITRSEVRTFSTRVFDRFTISEFDGSPISEARRLQIQVGVLSAIETPFAVADYKRAGRERRAQVAR